VEAACVAEHEDRDHARGHEDQRCHECALGAHADAANPVSARAPAAESRAEADEHPGHGDGRQRAHRPVQRGGCDKVEGQCRAREETGKENHPPAPVPRPRLEHAAEHARNTKDASGRQNADETRQSDQHAPGQGMEWGISAGEHQAVMLGQLRTTANFVSAA